MVRDRRYGGGNPSVYRGRDYSTQRRGVDMELYDRERERDMERGRVGIRGKGEYSPRRGGGGGGGGVGYERMRIVDGKYSPGRRGGDFERRRIGGEEGRRGGNGEYLREPPSEMLSGDYNRHSDVVGRKYSPGRGGGELEMPRRPGKEEERRGVGGGGYIHEQPRERLRDYNRNSNNVDARREYGSRPLQSYRGPDRNRSDNGRDDSSSRKFYHFDEGLSHVNRENLSLDDQRKPDGLMSSTNKELSGVDRWNHPLDEHRKIDGLKGSSDVVGVDAGVNSERDYFSRPYQLLDSNPLPLEAGKELGYSSSYPLDVSVPPKSFNISDGGSCGLTLAYQGTSLHKGESYHLHPEPYSKDEYHVGSSTFPKAFASMSSGGFKDDLTLSRRGHQALSDGFGLSSEMLNKPLLYDGYGEKPLTKSPLNPLGQSSDMRSYSQSYLIPCGEKLGSNGYPDVGRSEGDCIAAGSQGTHGNTLGGGEDYSHRDMLRTTNQDPIVDGMDQISRREHIRDSRPLVHHSYSRGKAPVNYVEGVGSSYARRDDVDALRYGDTRLEYEREAYKNYASDQPREPRGYGIGYDPWSQHDRSNVRTFGEYHDSPSRRLSPRDLSFPEPSKKILKRNSRELSTSSNGRIDRKRYDEGELDPIIESGKSKFSSSNHGKSGRRNRDVTSRLTSRNFSQPMSSLLSKSLTSTRGIKARLGPRPQNISTWHSQVSKNRSSVKNRLGPGPQNFHSSRLGNKFRSSLKKRLGPAA